MKELAKIEPQSAEVAQVVKWILSGATSFDISQAIATTYPDAEPVPLMLAAMRHFEQSGNFDALVVRGWCFEANRDLYRRMVEVEDFAGALRAVKQIMEMTKNVQHRDASNASDASAGKEETGEAEEMDGGAESREEPPS